MFEKDPNAKDSNSEDREPPSKPENSVETEKLDDRAKKSRTTTICLLSLHDEHRLRKSSG